MSFIRFNSHYLTLDLYIFDLWRFFMFIEKECVEILDPSLPIKTYIVNSDERILDSRLHMHTEIEMVYIIEGSMQFTIGDDSVMVNSGNIIFINGLTVHSSETTSCSYTKICLLQFDPGLVYNTNIASEYKYLIPFIRHDNFNYYLFSKNGAKEITNIAELLIEIAMEFESKEVAYEILIKSNLYKILTILYRENILNYNLLNTLVKEKALFPKLFSVLNFVENNYSENITVQLVSNMVGLNYYYFSRLFKATTGKPFVQYLTFVRVSVAEKLLLTTDKSITEIISFTGFSSLSYFNRSFKKLKRCNPTDYRKKLRQ